VKRYDILLIQEIRDASETAIEVLIDAVNNGFVSFLLATLMSFTHSLKPSLRSHSSITLMLHGASRD